MLYDKLKKYAESEVYPFHMPGHKRQDIYGDGIIPYNIDLTEIYDFDNLHSPNGCIKEIEEKAAQIYGVNNAFLLVNGATGGILSAVRAMSHRGDRVLIARNCHKSVYNAAELLELKAEYIFPNQAESDVKHQFYGSVNPNDIENKLRDFPDTKLVIITSPTYEGICSDIKAISDICRNHGAKLLVDEAHGAHFPFHDDFPSSAIYQGADAVVISLHKTLPSLTQTALLLTNDGELEKKLRSNLAVFETSSPSYVLMASIENCLRFLENSKEAFLKYIDNLNLFYNRIKTLKKLNVFNCENRDIGKLVILTEKTNLTGHQLANILRNEYKIETEMSSVDYVIAMTSVCDTESGFERLYNALTEIDSKCSINKFDTPNLIFEAPERKLFAYECQDCKSTLTDFKSAVGKVSLEYIYAYPPGIPLIVPGEVLSQEIYDNIMYQLKSGVDISSSDKNFPQKLSVAEL